jgi:PHD/YefM family antitoxin component YafN of YafNO toxin-antitoxin module
MHTITIKSDKPKVLISLEEYENLKETVELLSNNPKLAQELKKEREKIEKGEFVIFEDFKKKYKIK